MYIKFEFELESNIVYVVINIETIEFIKCSKIYLKFKLKHLSFD